MVTPDSPVRVRWARSRNDAGAALHGTAFTAEDSLEGVVEYTNGFIVFVAGSWATGRAPEEELGLILHGDDGSRCDVPSWRRGPTGMQARLSSARRGSYGAVEAGPGCVTYSQGVIAQAAHLFAACRDTATLQFIALQPLQVERVVAALRAERLRACRCSSIVVVVVLGLDQGRALPRP
jgi:hypothetical protein